MEQLGARGDVFLLWAASSMLRLQKMNIQVRRTHVKCLPPEKMLETMNVWKALGLRPTAP